MVSNYDWNAKETHIAPFLNLLDQEGMIGDTVLDIGSGPRPLSGVLKKEGRKLFAIDFVRPLVAHDFHHIRGDVRKVADPDSFATKRAVVKMASILGVDPRTAKPQQADTIIFSDILNYVPYEETVGAFAKYLKRGGLLVVLNQPQRTFKGAEHVLDPKGPKNPGEMVGTLERLGFRILVAVPLAETKAKGKNRFVPVRSLEGVSDTDSFMIFTVLRKENFLERTYNTLRDGGLRKLSDKDV